MSFGEGFGILFAAGFAGSLLVLFWPRHKAAELAPVETIATPTRSALFDDIPPRTVRTRRDKVERRLMLLWYKQGYLYSSNWRAKRRRILQRAGHRCEKCGVGGRLDIHHRTYERLRYEWPEDLQALCRPCHKRAHEENPRLRLY